MDIYLLNDVIVFLFIEAILLSLLLICEVSVIKILKSWNFELTTSKQYFLEKRNYLVNTIITFAIGAKLILFVFFVKSLGELSHVVPGSMCVAGVIGANDYGEFLLLLKIFIVFVLATWLMINKLDLQTKNFLYIKKKYIFFNFVLFLVIVEFILELMFFNDIPLKVPVFCCSTIFKADDLPFGLEKLGLVICFYVIYIFSLVANHFKWIILSFFANISFLFASYFAITYFFSTYVYVLPNHQCPFCILHAEYYYIGYPIWIALFLGVFFGISSYLIETIIGKQEKGLFKYSSFFNSIVAAICTYYVASYYIRTGVFL